MQNGPDTAPHPTGGGAARTRLLQDSGVQPADVQTVTEPLSLVTSDGERLRATHLTGPDPDRSLAVVVAHGFTLSIDKPGVQTVMRALAEHAGVIGFDFRGHGGSTGASTVGHLEVADCEAAVAKARELGYRDVVTCGWSMGGSVVMRHAAIYGGVEAVVSVSALSRWFYRGTKAMRRVHWAIQTRTGRLFARRMLATRISHAGWPEIPPEAPIDVVGRIAPIPLLLVHGDRDNYFPVEHPNDLFAAANEPKELWLVEGYGHAESAAGPELLDRIGAHLPALVARGPGRGDTVVDT
jgi:pimeloyl-ACP methyl ester carboxylesterase